MVSQDQDVSNALSISQCSFRFQFGRSSIQEFAMHAMLDNALNPLEKYVVENTMSKRQEDPTMSLSNKDAIRRRPSQVGWRPSLLVTRISY